MNRNRHSAKAEPASRALWRLALGRFTRNRLAALGVLIIFSMSAFAICGPLLSPYPFDELDFTALREPPGSAHWFGTDEAGRDYCTRVAHGARVSLIVAFTASVISLLIGVSYGAVSGYCGGWIDNLLMRAVDALYSIPPILFVIVLMLVLEPGLLSVLLALGLSYWLEMARITRGQVLQVKRLEYVQAARALGASNRRLLALHILPNCAGPILVTLTLLIPVAIFYEAFLSYIGLGIPEPRASLGSLSAEASKIGLIRQTPYLLFFPAAAISLTMLGFNFIGDGLRDALDPRDEKR